MFPAYFLGILIFALHTKNVSSFIKTTIALLTFFSFSLPMAVPIIKMPKPTGKNNIGTSTHHWIDNTRKEWFTESPDDFRQIMVQVWYPGQLGKKNKRAPYLDRIDILSLIHI